MTLKACHPKYILTENSCPKQAQTQQNAHLMPFGEMTGLMSENDLGQMSVDKMVFD